MVEATYEFTWRDGLMPWIRAARRRSSRYGDVRHLRRLQALGTDVLGDLRLQFREARRGLLPVVARIRQVDRELALDAPRPRAEDHAAIGHEDRLVDVVRDEQHGLLVQLPDRQQQLLHQRAGLVVERAEPLLH